MALALVSAPQSLAADESSDWHRLMALSPEELGRVKIDTVFAASRFQQKVTEAPSSVTIVTADEIKRFGYRTLAEIVQSVHSFDVTTDRNYSFTGVRGFNRFSDFGSSVLLLIDGHRMNDPIFDTAAVGTEGLLDVEMIERVEFIRGPGSALYGNNASLATINVVPRRGRAVDGLEVSSSTGSFETWKGRATFGKEFASGVEALFSISGTDTQGESPLFFREFRSPETNHGFAVGLDGGREWNLFGSLRFGDWQLSGGFVNRRKDVPTGASGSIFNAENFTVDDRGFAELRSTHDTANGWKLTGRLFYDDYSYHGNALYPGDDGLPFASVESVRERWWGAEFAASHRFGEKFQLTLGGEYRRSFEIGLSEYSTRPFVRTTPIDSELRVLAGFVEGDLQITGKLRLNAAVRLDSYHLTGEAFSPRAALIFQPQERTALKLIASRSRRAPSLYERDYLDEFTKFNPGLEPEEITTCEIVGEHYFAKQWRVSLSLFQTEAERLLEFETDPADGLGMSTNAGQARMRGAELEVQGKWENGTLLRASFTRHGVTDRLRHRVQENYPANSFKAQLSVPVVKGKVFASIEGIYTSDRITYYRARTGEALLLNATLFARELLPNLEISASVYNLTDRRYALPGSATVAQDTLEQTGRTFRLKLEYRF